MKQPFARFLTTTSVFLICFCTSRSGFGPKLFADDDAAAVDQPDSSRRRSAIRISRETTYLTEPLHPDGGIDYFAAIETELSRDVTAENNAAIPLMQAFGPSIIPESERKDFFQKLGMPPLPATGHYFVPLEDFEKKKGFQQGVLRSGFHRVVKDGGEPYTGQPFEALHTEMVEWLRLNDKALDQIVEASKRERFFTPLIAKDVGRRRMLLLSNFPLCERTSESTRALIDRSFEHVANGRFQEAWNDLFAVYCLARLMEQLPMQLPLIYAAGIDYSFHDALCDFLNRCPASSIQASGYLEAIQKRPSSVDYRKMLEFERFSLLDAIFLGSINKLPNHQPKVGEQRGVLETVAHALFWKALSWNLIMKEANRYHDQLENAFDPKPPVNAAEEISSLGRKLTIWKDEVFDPTQSRSGFFILTMLNLREQTTKSFGRKMIALYTVDFGRFYQSFRRRIVHHHLIHIMLALEAYRAQEQRFPEKLANLSPDFLSTIPESPFLNQNYVYALNSGSSYTLATLIYDEGHEIPDYIPTEIKYKREIEDSELDNTKKDNILSFWAIVVILALIGLLWLGFRFKYRR